jgi:hypothetical protein
LARGPQPAASRGDREARGAPKLIAELLANGELVVFDRALWAEFEARR